MSDLRVRKKIILTDLNWHQGYTRKHLRANFIVVHRQEYFPPIFVEFDCSKTRFDDPVLFLIRSNAWTQVMSPASPPVMTVQLRVMLEAGSTVIRSMCSSRWHLDRGQEDFISHFVSIANVASVKWRENKNTTHHVLAERKAPRLLWF